MQAFEDSSKFKIQILGAFGVLAPLLSTVFYTWFTSWVSNELLINFLFNPRTIVFGIITASIGFFLLKYILDNIKIAYKQNDISSVQQLIRWFPEMFIFTSVMLAIAGPYFIMNGMEVEKRIIVPMLVLSASSNLLNSLLTISILSNFIESYASNIKVIEDEHIKSFFFKFSFVAINGSIGLAGLFITSSYMMAVMELQEGLLDAIILTEKMSIIGITAIIQLVIPIMYTSKTISNQLIDIKKVTCKFTDGDLNATITNSSRSELGLLASALNNMALKLKNIVGSIKSNAQTISASSKMLANSSTLIGKGAMQQSSSSEQVVASVQQMTGSIESISETPKWQIG